MKRSLKELLERKANDKSPIEPYIPDPVDLVPIAPRMRLQIMSKWIYAYIRVSTTDQFKSGLGLESQFTHVAAFVERLIAERDEWKDHKFAGIYIDAPTSSVKKDLKDRFAGKVLCERLRPGDGVVFVRYDRAFRNFRHMLNQKHEWDKQKVRMVFKDLDIDLSTPLGEMMLYMYGIIARVEARNTADRTRAALAAKKARGDKLGRWPKVGMVIVRSHDPATDRRTSREFIRKDLFPIVRLIAFYKEKLGMAYTDIGDRVEELLAKREGRKPKARIRVRDGRVWQYDAIRKAYYTWKMLVEDRRRLNWWEHAVEPEEVGMVRGKLYLTQEGSMKLGFRFKSREEAEGLVK